MFWFFIQVNGCFRVFPLVRHRRHANNGKGIESWGSWAANAKMVGTWYPNGVGLRDLDPVVKLFQAWTSWTFKVKTPWRRIWESIVKSCEQHGVFLAARGHEIAEDQPPPPDAARAPSGSHPTFPWLSVRLFRLCWNLLYLPTPTYDGLFLRILPAVEVPQFISAL